MAGSLDDVEVVRTTASHVRLDYTVAAGIDQSAFLREIAHRRLVGQRCPSCDKVYVPPRGACPRCGVATGGAIEVAATGTVTTFCVVNVPYEGMEVELPYVCASVLLDGSDLAIFSLIEGIDPAEVRMGLRVEAVWVPDEAMGPTQESIRSFRPTGEPDAPYERYAGSI